MKQFVVLFWKDENGKSDLEKRLSECPRYNSPEAAKLILDYNEECVKKIIDYCDKKGIKYDRALVNTRTVFAKLTEEQIVQISSDNVIKMTIDEPMFGGAWSYYSKGP